MGKVYIYEKKGKENRKTIKWKATKTDTRRRRMKRKQEENGTESKQLVCESACMRNDVIKKGKITNREQRMLEKA